MRTKIDPNIVKLFDRGILLRLLGQGAVMTLVINGVGLVSPFYLTQIYDRVLNTGSGPTLVILTVATIFAIAIGAVFEQLRSVLFSRVAATVYVDLEGHAFRASHAASVAGVQGKRSQPLDDLEAVRGLISGGIPAALLDLVFTPLLIVVMFLISPWLGIFSAFALVSMAVVAVLTNWAIAQEMRKSAAAMTASSSLAESFFRVAEASAAMGFVKRAYAKWSASNRDAIYNQVLAAARAGRLNALARTIRSSAQILATAIAAVLVLDGQISAGSIFAASIIIGRLIQPVDVLLNGWKQVANARVAAERLYTLLKEPVAASDTDPRKPAGHLTVENLAAGNPDGTLALQGVNFQLNAGESLAILGATGAGKSTLLRSIMGVHPRVNGMVRLAGVPLLQMDREVVGRWIGFLPQNADLAPGTIGENIARFTDAPIEEIRAAAQAANADSMIESFRKGYDTPVGEIGAALSAGQRRRIALARALFGSPSLICLDEPEAHLDRDGEIALVGAMQAMKQRGVTVIIAAHKPSAVRSVDKALVLREGRVVQFGPAAEIFASLAPPELRRVPS